MSDETLDALRNPKDEAPGTIHRIAEASGKKFAADFAATLARLQARWAEDQESP